MVTFNFKINIHGQYMTSIINEVANCIENIERLTELENKTVQNVLANGFEINFNFVDKPPKKQKRW